MFSNKEKVLGDVKKIYRNARVGNSDGQSSEMMSLTVSSDHSLTGSLGTEKKGGEAQVVLLGSFNLEVDPLCSPVSRGTDKPASSGESGRWRSVAEDVIGAVRSGLQNGWLPADQDLKGFHVEKPPASSKSL